jgi:hypothetical protein
MRGMTLRHSSGLVGMPWMSTSGNPSPRSTHLIGTSMRWIEMPSTVVLLVSMWRAFPHRWDGLPK